MSAATEARFTKLMDSFNDRLAWRSGYYGGIYYFHVTGYFGRRDGSKSRVKEWAKDEVHPVMKLYREKLRAALGKGVRYFDRSMRGR